MPSTDGSLVAMIAPTSITFTTTTTTTTSNTSTSSTEVAVAVAVDDDIDDNFHSYDRTLLAKSIMKLSSSSSSGGKSQEDGPPLTTEALRNLQKAQKEKIYSRTLVRIRYVVVSVCCFVMYSTRTDMTLT